MDWKIMNTVANYYKFFFFVGVGEGIFKLLLLFQREAYLRILWWLSFLSWEMNREQMQKIEFSCTNIVCGHIERS